VFVGLFFGVVVFFFFLCFLIFFVFLFFFFFFLGGGVVGGGGGGGGGGWGLFASTAGDAQDDASVSGAYASSARVLQKYYKSKRLRCV